ncbi:MAG: hypothetical protein WD397_16920 [Wenzhouxiangellaceae bacterium]
MNKWSTAFLQAAIHSVLWVGTILFMVSMFSQSDSRLAYGYLTAWWLSLYVGYIAGFRLLSAFIAIVIYMGVGMFAVWFDWAWFYRGLPDTVSTAYLATLLLGAVIFCSPILVNSTVRIFMAIKLFEKHP